MKFQRDLQNSIFFFSGKGSEFMLFQQKKSLFKLKELNGFWKKILKCVLPEHNNIPESRFVW
jgi:hypothetical protein